jgi:hypothetical protein
MQQTKGQPGRFQSAHWCAAAGSGSGSAREASAGNDAEEPTGVVIYLLCTSWLRTNAGRCLGSHLVRDQHTGPGKLEAAS